jgi:type III pantothenate kinase
MNAASFVGVIDIGNSGLKMAMAQVFARDRNATAAIHPAHDLDTTMETGHRSGSKSDFLSFEKLYWRYGNDQGKSPPKEWEESGSHWAALDDLEAISEVIRKCRSVAYDQPIVRWLVSSVQPQALESIKRCFYELHPFDELRVLTHKDVPIQCQLDIPEQVGIDRLVAAWGAWRSLSRPSPLIVIQAGTAITVDWIDETGVYHGGAIMPGISLTLKYLALGTAHLPWLAPPLDPTQVVIPGRNTHEAIMAGVNAGFVGGIELLIDKYSQQFHGDRKQIQIVLSGGDGPALSKAIKTPIQVFDNLVLKSLVRLRAEALD